MKQIPANNLLQFSI